MVRGRRLWVCSAALAAGAVVRPAAGLPYGVNAHIPSYEQLAAAARVGVEWVRIDLNWYAVEPAPGQFDWSVYDKLADDAEANGLRVYATLAYTPAWATTGPPVSGVPDDAATWYDFCFRAAQRYRGRIEHFGMWNEPNLGRFWAGDRTQYVQVILGPGSAAVRAANPRAKVCGPELAHIAGADWDGWLGYVLGQAPGAIDIVTHHAYPSGSGAGSVIDKLNNDQKYPWDPRSLAQVLRGAGWFPRPVWLTETGYDCGSADAGAEATQAGFVTGVLSGLFGPNRSIAWVNKVFIYELSDDPGIPGVAFGLLGAGPDFRVKPAAGAYAGFASDNPIDDAEVVTASLPAVLRPGEQVEASVTVRNTGSTTWSGLLRYALGAVGDRDAFAASPQYLPQGRSVAPGETVTFAFPFTAPGTAASGGQLSLTRWQMRRQGFWSFGEARSQTVSVTSADPVARVLYVPGLANNPGLNGTMWRSDLSLYDAGPEPAEVTVVALENNRDNTSPRTAHLTVAAGTQQRVGDVLAELFGLSAPAALRLDVVRGNVAVLARSYTTCGDGTCGQSLTTLPAESAAPSGTAVWLRALAHSADRAAGSRTNIGLINPTAQAIWTEVALYGDAMAPLGAVDVELPPYGFRQANDVFRGVGAPDVRSGTASVRTLVDGTSLLAWASVVDNVSGEPTFVAPSSPSDEPLVIATSAHNDGLQGSRWRSDLALFNPGAGATQLRVDLLAAATAPPPPSALLSLPGLDDEVVADVVGTLFGFAGSGALRITPTGGAAAAFSTTYNAASAGRLGQGVPAVRQSAAAVFGEQVILLQLSGASDRATGMRSNVGFVNVSGIPIEVDVELYRSPGTSLGTLTVPLAALEWRQLTDVFRMVSAEVDDGFAIVRSPTPGGRVIAYASVVDNASGDPFLVPGQ